MYPHRIRLRGPWECTPAGQEPRRATVPCRLTAPGPLVFVRKFGYPGRLDHQERVWLILAHVGGQARLSLNGHDLGAAPTTAFAKDVTADLKQHNRLEIILDGQELGECYLEIRAAAYLDGVRLTRHPSGKIRVAGTVAGSWDRPLELYVMADGRNAFYRTICAGESFAYDLEEAAQKVRVELVNAATVWYVVEVVVAQE